MKFSRLFIWTIALSTTLMVACGGETSSTDSSTQAKTEEAAKPEIPASVELSIEGNDMMKYNLDRMEAFEGQKVTLTLTHTGKLAKEAMGHNWVLLAKGTDIMDFSSAAMQAAETEYIPADWIDSIFAHTSLVGGGESTTVEFTAPAAGVYTFICSFPGHSALMQGKFVSRA
ncbi:MAG: azurin, partial [Bacteroidia bacterium]|nr:azurin [Bacteroidia bacterium]